MMSTIHRAGEGAMHQSSDEVPPRPSLSPPPLGPLLALFVVAAASARGDKGGGGSCPRASFLARAPPASWDPWGWKAQAATPLLMPRARCVRSTVLGPSLHPNLDCTARAGCSVASMQQLRAGCDRSGGAREPLSVMRICRRLAVWLLDTRELRFTGVLCSGCGRSMKEKHIQASGSSESSFPSDWKTADIHSG